MGFGDKSKKEKAAEKNASAEASRKAAAEAASWQDTDKKSMKKAQASSAQEEADAEKARLKAEKAAQEAAEEAEMTKASAPKKKKGAAPGKLTQAQIAQNLAMLSAAMPKQKVKMKKTVSVEPAPLHENTNHLNDISATGVDAALKELEKLDLNKAKEKYTWKMFEEEFLEEVKADNPGLKKNQLNEKLWKMWERSKLNPKNQEDAPPAKSEKWNAPKGSPKTHAEPL